jgi:DNA processing protein
MTSQVGQRLTDSQRLDWLRLIRSESVGPRTFRALINQFGGARQALEALPDLLRRRGVGPLAIMPLAAAEAELTAIERAGARLIARGEPDYPMLLSSIDSAPPLLTVRGDVSVLTRPAVALVGARNASAQGLRFAALLARELGQAGLAVISGLARGIDASAHEASVGTGTVAVLAGGLGRLYPPEHGPLAEKIVQTGCLVTEMPFDWTATGRDFPRRNRIVSGLAYGTVVVEAALRSGSLITARFANEQGREVFAVPGSPLDPRSEGTNRLIREGATLVTGAPDILEALAPTIARGEAPLPRVEESGGEDEPLWDELDGYASADRGTSAYDLTDLAEPEAKPADAKLLDLLGSAPLTVDDLVRLSGLSLRAVQVALVDLELAGRLERHGENRFSRL